MSTFQNESLDKSLKPLPLKKVKKAFKIFNEKMDRATRNFKIRHAKTEQLAQTTYLTT